MNSLLLDFQFLKDLNTDLKYALGGSLENLLLAMMQAPAVYDASELRRAMKVKPCSNGPNIVDSISSNNFQITFCTVLIPIISRLWDFNMDKSLCKIF